MRERSPSTIMLLALWGLVAVFLGLFFGGEPIPTCLALGDAAVAACQAAWHAAQPPPPPDIVNLTRPWPWVGLFLVGASLIVGVAVIAARRERP